MSAPDVLLMEIVCPTCDARMDEISLHWEDPPTWHKFPVRLSAKEARDIARNGDCDDCGTIGGALFHFEPVPEVRP